MDDPKNLRKQIKELEEKVKAAEEAEKEKKRVDRRGNCAVYAFMVAFMIFVFLCLPQIVEWWR